MGAVLPAATDAGRVLLRDGYETRSGTPGSQDMVCLVTASSKGLAELTKSDKPTVQFIHESVRDFLLKDNGLYELWPHLTGKVESTSHDELKHCCQRYLTVDVSELAPLGSALPKASSTAGADLRSSANDLFPFLEYASQHVFYHADRAVKDVPQADFLKKFPLNVWIHATNLLQRYENQRRGPDATVLYVLAENGYASLVEIVPKTGQWGRLAGERYGYPCLAAFANGHRGILDLLADTNTSISVEDITKDPGYGKASQLRRRGDPLRWAAKNKNWNLVVPSRLTS